jgi:hypothetical protein
MTACTERSFLRSSAGRSQTKTVCASRVARTSSVAIMSPQQSLHDAALGVAFVQGEEEAKHFIGRIDPQKDQSHKETSAFVLGELGPCSDRSFSR